MDDLKYIHPIKHELIEDSRGMMKLLDGLKVEEYDKAVILPIRAEPQGIPDLGGVLTNEGEYIISSVIPGWASGYYDDFEKGECAPETVVYCGRMIGQWGHFLLETITRLWFFLEYDNPNYKYVFIVKEGTTPPIEGNFKLFFNLLGISERIILLNKATQYNKVIIPERSFQYRRFYSPKYLKIIDKVIENALISKATVGVQSRIYLTRSKFKKAQRTEVGLEMLDNFFANNGYQIISPENMPLDEFICRLRTADICAAESGTVAHNFIFCSKEQNTIVIERQAMVNDVQTSIEVLRDFKTVYVEGHLTLHSIYSGAGPFFLCYTPRMKMFAENMGYMPPDKRFVDFNYIRKCFVDYKAIYSCLYEKIPPSSGNSKRFDPVFKAAYNDTHQWLIEMGIT